MSLIDTFTPNTNFWVTNPQLTALGPFKELYDLDTSKDKTISSQMMWAVAFYIDAKSKFISMPDIDRQTIITKDICPSINFKNQTIITLVDFYKETQLTQAEKSLVNFYSKLRERDTFIANTEYSIDNAESLDRILANTKKMYDMYEKIKEDLTKESTTITTRGGKTPSLSDSDNGF